MVPPVSGSRHSLREAPAVMRPVDVTEVDPPVEGVVVVVVGGVVVVVVGGDDVVLEDEPPPVPPPPVPPPPPPPPPPPVETVGVAVGAAVAVGVVGEIEEIVDQRFTRPENWLLLDSDASVKTTSERTELESRPPNADAEASMLTIATRMDAETANVMAFGTRWAVFARKKFLRASLYMEYKLAVSGHDSAYSLSTVRQFGGESTSDSSPKETKRCQTHSTNRSTISTSSEYLESDERDKNGRRSYDSSVVQ